MNAFYQHTTAPGREGTTPADAPTAPVGQPAAPSAFGGLSMFIPMIAVVVLMLWMTRSQSKKQKQLEAGLKIGDRVVTTSGLLGKVTEIGEPMRLEVAPGVNVQVLKSSVQRILNPTGEAKPLQEKKS